MEAGPDPRRPRVFRPPASTGSVRRPIGGQPTLGQRPAPGIPPQAVPDWHCPVLKPLVPHVLVFEPDPRDAVAHALTLRPSEAR